MNYIFLLLFGPVLKMVYLSSDVEKKEILAWVSCAVVESKHI